MLVAYGEQDTRRKGDGCSIQTTIPFLAARNITGRGTFASVTVPGGVPPFTWGGAGAAKPQRGPYFSLRS